MEIDVGTLIEATTASGQTVRMRAVARPKQGRDFPVVWVCTEAEYDQSQRTHQPADSLPWPLTAVKVAESV